MVKSLSHHLPSNWLWVGVNMASLLPLIRLVWMLIEVPDSPGPVMFASGTRQNIILFSGQAALVLLVLSLTCTPAARILGFTQAIKVRKSLGLWGFCYACFHALFFLGGKELLFTGEAWLSLWQMLPDLFTNGLGKTPYARYGAYALALILPLALTSNRLSLRLLRNNWKRLHRLVYLAVPLAIYHYWQRKEFITFTGEAPDYWRPIVFGVVLALLLIARIPPVRRWLAARLSIARWRTRRDVPKAQTVSRNPDIPAVPQPGQHLRLASGVNTNGHLVKAGETNLQVKQSPANGEQSIVIWPVYITYKWRRQHRKPLLFDPKQMETGPPPDGK